MRLLKFLPAQIFNGIHNEASLMSYENLTGGARRNLPVKYCQANWTAKLPKIPKASFPKFPVNNPASWQLLN
jgi:hypothetical protein